MKAPDIAVKAISAKVRVSTVCVGRPGIHNSSSCESSQWWVSHCGGPKTTARHRQQITGKIGRVSLRLQIDIAEAMYRANYRPYGTFEARPSCPKRKGGQTSVLPTTHPLRGQ